jgi:cytoskeletal protein CcmA (bactofilin family)
VEIRQILLRTDTAANWSSVNPVLGAGEVGTESDTTLQKVGDGVTAWNSLPYKRVDLLVTRDSASVTVGAAGDDAVLPAATPSLAGVMSAADKTKLDGISSLGDVSSSDDNVFTGANSFLNSSGQVFGTDAAEEDGIIVAGRAGGSGGYRVTLQPEALSGNRQLTAPDRSGTIITSADSGTVTSAMMADGTIVNADINASAAIADTKLATISTAGKVANSATTATSANTPSAIVARDASGNFSAGTITAALSGNAATAAALQTPRNINGVSFNGSGDITLTAATPNAITFNSGGSGGASGSSFTGNSALTVSHNTVGAPSTTGVNASGTWGISVTGNAATATALSSSRSFALTGDVTGTVSSDLTSGASIATAIAPGAIVNADINASAAIADTKLATISTAGKVANSATTAASANTPSAIVARDASGNFSAGTITAGLSGNAATATALSSSRSFALTGDVTGTVSSDLTSGASIATAIAPGAIVNADINASAAIADTKLATISTAGKVANSATTAASANTPSAIVARDANGDVNISSINSGSLAGMRNAIINGNFDFWTRGTSFTGSGYGADRWVNNFNNTTCTLSRRLFASGQTNVPGNPTYWCQMEVASSAGAASFSTLVQRIEDVRTFAGMQVTVSFWAKADATKNIALEFSQGFGTGGSPSASVDAIGVVKKTLTTSWQKITHTVTIPSISGKSIGSDQNSRLAFLIYFDAGSNLNSRTDSLGQQSGTFDIAQVQIEPGPVATLFECRPPGVELALCQRYYERGTSLQINLHPRAVTAYSTTCNGVYTFLVEKRATPTISGAVFDGVTSLTQEMDTRAWRFGGVANSAGVGAAIQAGGFAIDAEL